MKIYQSSITEKENSVIFSDYINIDNYSYIGNKLSLVDIMSIFKLISPTLININGNIYLKEHFDGYSQDENNRFDNSPKGKEKYINNFAITDLFYFSNDQKSRDKELQITLGEKILMFWKIRLTDLFPNIEFEFILSENGLYDESDVCITFCQK